MTKYALAAVYILLIVVANYTVALLGPWITPLNALLLIGIDFVIRDKLSLSLSKIQLIGLVVAASVLTFLFNAAPMQIAVASSVAFLVSQLLDTFVFFCTKGAFVRKSFISNLYGAAMDSVLFPLIAFGGFMPDVSSLQFLCKVTGASVVLYVLTKSTSK